MGSREETGRKGGKKKVRFKDGSKLRVVQVGEGKDRRDYLSDFHRFGAVSFEQFSSKKETRCWSSGSTPVESPKFIVCV